MKNALTLGTVLLGCCLAASAQMGSTPNQTPAASTPSTFPNQTGQSPANPANPSAIPPDTNAPGGMASDQAKHPSTQASSSQMTTIQGCLSQVSAGNFMLADSSGTNFQLRGDTSRLSSYVGKEVKVEGIVAAVGSSAGAMSSSSGAGAATQFSVNNVHKVADACATGSSTKQ